MNRRTCIAAVRNRCRLLPLTALVAFVVMAVKLSAVWNAVWGGAATGVSATAVIATASAATGAPAPTTGHPAGKAPAKPGSGHDQPGPPDAAREPAGDADRSAQAERAPALDRAGPLLTASEITVLQQLAERREELARRAEALDRRETLLRAAEQRLDEKLQALKGLQGTLERLIAEYKSQQDEQTQTLVKIYENMKPKDAARIFAELEMGTLLAVADRMKERKLAALLAEMNPVRAKEVTEELARLRALPAPAAAPPTGAADAANRS